MSPVLGMKPLSPSATRLSPHWIVPSPPPPSVRKERKRFDFANLVKSILDDGKDLDSMDLDHHPFSLPSHPQLVKIGHDYNPAPYPLISGFIQRPT